MLLIIYWLQKKQRINGSWTWTLSQLIWYFPIVKRIFSLLFLVNLKELGKKQMCFGFCWSTAWFDFWFMSIFRGKYLKLITKKKEKSVNMEQLCLIFMGAILCIEIRCIWVELSLMDTCELWCGNGVSRYLVIGFSVVFI